MRIWQGARWLFRADTLFLVPGDSPIGHRLPLESLPWADEKVIEQETEADPFAPRRGRCRCAGIPRHLPLSDSMGAGAEGFRPVVQESPNIGRGEPGLVRTALGVEPRGGVIHVFFPPLYDAEDWLALAAAIEDTAAELGHKVVLEGYLPPRDARLQHFSVTPDPGVIEVNVHPSVDGRN